LKDIINWLLVSILVLNNILKTFESPALRGFFSLEELYFEIDKPLYEDLASLPLYLHYMLYRLTAVILLIVNLLFNFSAIFVQVSFGLNQEYIAKEFCVNKNRPELHCNGQCYLKKKLKQAEEKEQKQNLKAQEQSFPVTNIYVFSRYFFKTSIALPNASAKTLPAVGGSVFHPPQFPA
jgi:hypothetical protein